MKQLKEQIKIIAAFVSDFPKIYKFLTAFVRMILRKIRIDGFTRWRQK